MANTSWKMVGGAAAGALAIAGIGVAYVLGQQSAVPVQQPVIVQASTSPSALPPPAPAAGSPSPEAAPAQPSLVEQMHASAVRIASLRGEDLVGALWRMESNVTERVTYAQLERNAERYTGTPAIYSGEVLEIHDHDDGAFLRIAVDDNYDHAMAVFAAVPPADSIVRGRRVRVYGLLAGSFSYTSQANYELTIPRIVGIAVVPASTPRRAPRP